MSRFRLSRFHLWRAVLASFFLAACTPLLVVPPVHQSQGDSPRALPPGAMNIGLGATGLGISSSILGDGVGVAAVNVEAARGLGRGFDLRVIGTRAWMSATTDDYTDDPNDNPYNTTEHDYLKEAGFTPDLAAVALRLKWNPGYNRFLALTLGTGQGWSQGRSWYSFETAGIFGVENRFFVPYLNLKYMVNIPTSSRPIVWKDSPHWDPYTGIPRKTTGVEILSGYKIPLTGHRQPWNRTNPVYFKAEGSLLVLTADTTSAIGLSISAAIVFPLGRF